MDKRHQTFRPRPGLPVDELNPRRPKLPQGGLDIVNLQADVMEPLPPALKKPGNRTLTIEGLQQLQVSFTHRQERHPNPVPLDRCDVFNLEAEPVPEKGQGRSQVPDGDGDVVNPLRLHG